MTTAYTEVDRKKAMAHGALACVVEQINKDYAYLLPSHVQAMLKCAMKLEEEANTERARARAARDKATP